MDSLTGRAERLSADDISDAGRLLRPDAADDREFSRVCRHHTFDGTQLRQERVAVALSARCRQVRNERGWTTKDVASALKVARYKIDAVEKGPVRDYELEVAVRYFRLLGLET